MDSLIQGVPNAEILGPSRWGKPNLVNYSINYWGKNKRAFLKTVKEKCQDNSQVIKLFTGEHGEIQIIFDESKGVQTPPVGPERGMAISKKANRKAMETSWNDPNPEAQSEDQAAEGVQGTGGFEGDGQKPLMDITNAEDGVS